VVCRLTTCCGIFCIGSIKEFRRAVSSFPKRITRAKVSKGLLDDLGSFADVWVYAYAQLLGRLEIEDDLVLIEALDPDVARFCSLENAIDEAGRA
jgi:hypothetical protein